eukprot:Lithocolla_globosa_v1_NODE_2903_length_1830_cov_9.584225.p1 type:complete len:595 gc:universal NODE_2903_length_1830_cov_9.584225:31-1815(+)
MPKDSGFYVGNYMVEKTIGQGTYGKVKLGYQLQNREKVAIKVIEKASIENERQVKRIQKEIRFLKLLSHPSIVKVYDVLETEKEIFIVMEYASGGELFDYIVANKRVKEKEARSFFRQIISAVDYCHQNSVIHRDLKPENLLLDDQKRMKIIDFGFSNTFASNELLNTFCGSPFYAAPEMILGKRYEGPEVDVWSLGVILFALLCGHLPFDDDDQKELYRKIASATYTTPSYLTADAKNLISRMITVHPKKRATLEEIKSHVWVNEGYSGPPENLIENRQPIDAANPNQEIVEKLIQFGYTEADIQANLKKPTINPISSTYYLIQEMFKRDEEKMKKLLESKKAMKEMSGSLMALPEDKPISEVKVAQTVSGGSGGNKYGTILDDFTRGPVGGDGASTPTSPTSPEGEQQPQQAPKTSNPLITGRRASVAVTTPSSQPGAPTVGPLFPNKHDKSSGAGAGGTPTPHPAQQVGRRLSLPALEYSAKKENSRNAIAPGQMRTISGLFNASTTSNKMPAEIVKEIERVLVAAELVYEFDGNYTFICEDTNRKTPISFEIEICKINRLSMFGIHLKRIRGSIWNYKKLANKIVASMVL